MFGSNILDVMIGLFFIYLLLSLITSAINEAIATTINQRGKNLFRGIKNLFNDQGFTGLTKQVYSHGLIAGLFQDALIVGKSKRAPSYIPPNTFSLVLLDILGAKGVQDSWNETVAQRKKKLAEVKAKFDANQNDPELKKQYEEAKADLEKAQAFLEVAATAQQAHDEAEKAAQQVKGPNDLNSIKDAAEKMDEILAIGRNLLKECPDPLDSITKGVKKLSDVHTKQALLVLIEKTRRETTQIEKQFEKLKENVEHWFNSAMEGVSGWYKRWTQIVVLLVAILLVVGANADTIMLTKRLSRDNVLRASVVAAAEKVVPNNTAGATQDNTALVKTADMLALPLGWVPNNPDNPKDPINIEQRPITFLGWLFKALGFLITIFAVSLGAPFWFDMLSKVTNIRGAVKPSSETKKDEPQTDKSKSA